VEVTVGIIFNLLKGYNESYQARRSESTGGSPAYAISREQLKFLSSKRFTNIKIGQLLGVSSKTIQRRKK
jgi:hypothetical protein